MQILVTYPTILNVILDPIIIYDDMPYTDCGVIDTLANINEKAKFLLISLKYL